jgi:DNA topoisomerase-3
VHVAQERFVARGRVVRVEGWKAVEPDADELAKEDSDNDEQQSLPSMKQADPAQCSAVEMKQAKTKPPARFTEGTLIRAMERIHTTVSDPEHKKILREGDGIGTSATRATILKDLKRRQFLDSRGKHIVSTPMGRALIDALPESVRSPSLTALYERFLRAVEAGEVSLEAFVERQERFVRERVAEAATGTVTLPSWTAPRGSHPAKKATRTRSKVRSARGATP